MMSNGSIDPRKRPGVAFSPGHPLHGIDVPLDYTAGGPSIGYQSWHLDYRNTSGPNNLRPGFPTVITTAVTWPSQPSTAIIVLRGFWGCYLNDDGQPFADHWIGGIEVSSFFQDNNTIGCEFWLTDASQDRSVELWANGFILFYGA